MPGTRGARPGDDERRVPAAAAKPSEISLIRAARDAVEADPRRALALTNTHKRLYPQGVLSQERDVIAIEALRALGQEQAARSKAESFRQEHPDSAHGSTVPSSKP